MENKKWKLKEGVKREKAVVHCPEEWMWGAVTEALGHKWGNVSWDRYATKTCISLRTNDYDSIKFYKSHRLFAVLGFYDIFEEVEDLKTGINLSSGENDKTVIATINDKGGIIETTELYDLTKIGRVPAGVMVEVSNRKDFAKIQTLELVEVFDAGVVVTRNEYGSYDTYEYARHPQPKQTTRPMNFEEVCDKVGKGATFVRKNALHVYNPSVTVSHGKVLLDGDIIAGSLSHYTLPNDTAEYKLEVTDAE